MENMDFDEFIERYEELTRPSVLLKTPEEVKAFLTGATREEIAAFIDACVADEAYEWAQIAKDGFSDF